MVVQVKVIGFRDENMTINLCNSEEELKTMTVLQLKKKIVEYNPTLQEVLLKETGDNGSAELLIFFPETKWLSSDSALLTHYGIQHKSIIRLVLTLSGGGCSPGESGDGMGDKDGETRRSQEKLANFQKCNLQ